MNPGHPFNIRSKDQRSRLQSDKKCKISCKAIEWPRVSLRSVEWHASSLLLSGNKVIGLPQRCSVGRLVLITSRRYKLTVKRRSPHHCAFNTHLPPPPPGGFFSSVC